MGQITKGQPVQGSKVYLVVPDPSTPAADAVIIPLVGFHRKGAFSGGTDTDFDATVTADSVDNLLPVAYSPGEYTFEAVPDTSNYTELAKFLVTKGFACRVFIAAPDGVGGASAIVAPTTPTLTNGAPGWTVGPVSGANPHSYKEFGGTIGAFNVVDAEKGLTVWTAKIKINTAIKTAFVGQTGFIEVNAV